MYLQEFFNYEVIPEGFLNVEKFATIGQYFNSTLDQKYDFGPFLSQFTLKVSSSYKKKQPFFVMLTHKNAI